MKKREETAVPETAAVPAKFDLHSPEYYLNRELTWLEFNKRVLSEAADVRNPLLERVFFLAVVHSNLDEFFMKRIGGLKQQVGAGVKELTVDGRLPQEQIDACYLVVQGLVTSLSQIEQELRGLLAAANIKFILSRFFGSSAFDHDLQP